MSRSQVVLLVLIGTFVLLILAALAWLFGVGSAASTGPPGAVPAEMETAGADVIREPSSNPPEDATETPEAPAPVPATAAPAAPESPTPGGFDPLACLPQEEGVMGQVVEVLAEAVLRVDTGDQIVAVKLLGADSAGSGGQGMGLLRELAEGKTVRMLRDTDDADAAGRLLRYVLAEDVFLNYELVRRGAALPALFPPGQACSETLLAAEQMARSEGLGYWSLRPGTAAALQAAETPVAPPCDCSIVYQCTDFKTRSEAQACYNACGDYRNVSLDEDVDGLACELLP